MNRNVTAVILIVLAIGVYLTFTSPSWDEAKAIGTVNGSYLTAIDNADKLIRVRDQVLASYNALSANDQDRLNKILPTSQDNIRLIIDLNSVALRKGITLHGIKVSAPADKNDSPAVVVQAAPAAAPGMPGAAAFANPLPAASVDAVTISFSTTAAYQTFIQFMRDLEANLRVMDMTHLAIKASDTGLYDYTVELKTYWLRQQ